MVQYHQKPPVFEIHPYQEPDVASVQDWLNALDPAEFQRVGFDSVTASAYPYTDQNADPHTGCRIQAWRNGSVYQDLTVYAERLIVWEVGESTVFEILPAADLAKFEPVAE